MTASTDRVRWSGCSVIWELVIQGHAASPLRERTLALGGLNWLLEVRLL